MCCTRARQAEVRNEFYVRCSECYVVVCPNCTPDEVYDADMCTTCWGSSEEPISEDMSGVVRYIRGTVIMPIWWYDAPRQPVAVTTEVQTECLICTEVVEAGVEAATAGCSHNFHSTCLQDWFRTSATCPTCRQSSI